MMGRVVNKKNCRKLGKEYVDKDWLMVSFSTSKMHRHQENISSTI